MAKWYERASKVLIAGMFVAATLFAVFSLGMLMAVNNGIAMGQNPELSDGWYYQSAAEGE